MENELIKKAIAILENQKRPEQITQTYYGEYTPYQTGLINSLWQGLTEQERTEIRSILE